MADSFSKVILTEILKRLPVPSLIKLMLVQKSWYRLIQSPYFNKALYSYHQKNTTYILFHTENYKHPISLRVNDKQCNQYSSLPLPEDIKLNEYMKIPGISNGLICLHYSRPLWPFQIFLWNPVIRKYKTIPHCPIPNDPHRSFHLIGLVFGYVPKMNDYKLINIVKYLDERKHQTDKVGVFVYSLSTNSWKTVCKQHTKATYFEDPVIVNGAAYWVCALLIVCFDIESEIIRDIMLPPKYSSGYDFQVTLAQNSSDLFLFGSDIINDHPRFLDIWILGKQAGIKDVWTKKFTLDLEFIEDASSFWTPQCFRNNREIILIRCHPYGYKCYDIEKDEPTEIIDDLSDLCSALNVEPCMQEIQARLFVENLGLLGDKSYT